MKTKLLIPVMAFVFAIGLSFTTERSTADAIYDYVDMGLVDPVKIAEVNCDVGIDVCEGRFEDNGPLYQIYDGPGLTNPKQGTGEVNGLLIPVED